MAKSGGGAGRGGSAKGGASGGGYTNGSPRQQSFADKLKDDAIRTINADVDKAMRQSGDAATRVRLHVFRNRLIEAVTKDNDVNSVINKLDMQTWKLSLIAKAYGYKP